MELPTFYVLCVVTLSVVEATLLHPQQLATIHAPQIAGTRVLPNYQLVVPYPGAAPVHQDLLAQISARPYDPTTAAYQRRLISDGRGQYFVVLSDASVASQDYPVHDGYVDALHHGHGQTFIPDQLQDSQLVDTSYVSETADASLRQQNVQQESEGRLQNEDDYDDLTSVAGSSFQQPDSPRYSPHHLSGNKLALATPGPRSRPGAPRVLLAPAGRAHTQQQSHTVNFEGTGYGYGYSVGDDIDDNRYRIAATPAGQRGRYFATTTPRPSQRGTQ